jgi:sortase A
MKKTFFIFLLLGFIAIGAFNLNSSLFRSNSESGTLNASDVAPGSNTLGVTSNVTPIPDPVVEPVTFTIPKLGVQNVKVESVGLDKENKMDIPKDENNVAWYNMGAKPGELGNAVIAGHFDKKTGAPAVFYEIGKLKPGDELKTKDRDGQERTFIVTEVKTYELSEFPLEEVFGLGDKARLNLITCEGTYDKTSQLYSHRLVVYSELKSQERSSPVKT